MKNIVNNKRNYRKVPRYSKTLTRLEPKRKGEPRYRGNTVQPKGSKQMLILLRTCSPNTSHAKKKK